MREKGTFYATSLCFLGKYKLYNKCGTLREVCCSTHIASEGATAMKVTRIVGYVAGAVIMVTPVIASASTNSLKNIDQTFSVHDQLAETVIAGDVKESIAIAKADSSATYDSHVKTANFGHRGGFGFSYFGGSPYYGGSSFGFGFNNGFNSVFISNGFGFGFGGGFNRGFVGRRGFSSRGFGGRRFVGGGFNRGFVGSRGFNRGFVGSRGFNRGFSGRRGFSNRGFSRRGFSGRRGFSSRRFGR